MKRILLALTAISLMLSTSALAKLGYTLEQCRIDYGTEIKSEPAWCGGQAYSFISNAYYMYVVIPAGSDKVADITYFDNATWKPLTKAQRDYVWLHNLDLNQEWESAPNWDGKHQVNKPYQHWVAYRRGRIGLTGIVENAGLANKAGWQVRTLDQFKAENAFYSSSLKTAKK